MGVVFRKERALHEFVLSLPFDLRQIVRQYAAVPPFALLPSLYQPIEVYQDLLEEPVLGPIFTLNSGDGHAFHDGWLYTLSAKYCQRLQLSPLTFRVQLLPRGPKHLWHAEVFGQRDRLLVITGRHNFDVEGLSVYLDTFDLKTLTWASVAATAALDGWRSAMWTRFGEHIAILSQSDSSFEKSLLLLIEASPGQFTLQPTPLPAEELPCLGHFGGYGWSQSFVNEPELWLLASQTYATRRSSHILKKTNSSYGLWLKLIPLVTDNGH